MKTFQIVAKDIPNNIRIDIPMKVWMSFMLELKKENSHFDLDVIQIEQYVNITCVTWKSKDMSTSFQYAQQFQTRFY